MIDLCNLRIFFYFARLSNNGRFFFLFVSCRTEDSVVGLHCHYYLHYAFFQLSSDRSPFNVMCAIYVRNFFLQNEVISAANNANEVNLPLSNDYRCDAQIFNNIARLTVTFVNFFHVEFSSLKLWRIRDIFVATYFLRRLIY